MVYQKKAVLLQRKIIPMTKCIYFITLILILAACQPQLSSTPFYEGQEVTLIASVPGSLLGDGKGEQLPSIQRITGKDSHPQSTTDGAINLSWSAGDQIVVRVGERSAIFDLISGEGTGLGSFRGTMPADGTEYQVSYPVAYHDSLLRHQNYVKDGFGNGLMKMRTKQAGTLDNGFELHADNALLGLQLKGEHILGNICVTNLSNDSTYTLHCDGVSLQTDAAMLFYLVVPVAGWSDGMRVEVYDQEGRIILRKEKADAMAFAAAEAIVMPVLGTYGPNKRIGIFSVSPTKKVSFSQGNLQYIQSVKTWQFARNQLKYMGYRHYQNGQIADTVEYFGWSAKNSKAPWGISLSVELSDYAGAFLDWGTNAIGCDTANTWRTLTKEEWLYLCNERTAARQLLGLAQIETITGLVLLPDSWVAPEGITFIPNSSSSELNTFTKQQWLAMEAAGAVFLAPAGYFNHKLTNMRGVDVKGYYRVGTLAPDGRQIYAFYKPDGFIDAYSGSNNGNLYYAFPVRLVHDTIQP